MATTGKWKAWIMAILVAATMLLGGGLTSTAYAAEDLDVEATEPKSGWNDDYSVLDIHGAELESADSLEAYWKQLGDYKNPSSDVTLKGSLGPYSRTEDVTIGWNVIKGLDVTWAASDSLGHGKTIGLMGSFEYSMKFGVLVLSGSGSVGLGSFAVNVFDIVKITTIDGSSRVESFAKVYRDASTLVLPVEDRSEEGLLVDVFVVEKTADGGIVRVAIEPNADGKYVLSENGLTGDVEVEITYTKDTQSTVEVAEDGGATVTVPPVVDANASVEIAARPAANSYIEGISLQADEGDLQALEVSYADENGTAAAGFTAAPEKTAYRIYIDSKPILVVDEALVGSVPYYDGVSYSDLMASLFALVSEGSADCVDFEDVSVQFGKNQLIGQDQWVDLNEDSLRWFGKSALGFSDPNGEKIKISYKGGESNKYPAASTDEITIALVDSRTESVLVLNEGVSFQYGTELVEGDMLNLVFGSLKTANGEDILAQPDDFVVSYPAEMNVGTHTVTVEYKGDANHKPTRATVAVTVEKAPVDVSVESKVEKYADIKDSGVNISDLASSNPSVDLMTFAVGLNLGDDASADAEVAAYVNIPDLLDNPSASAVVSGILKAMGLGDLQGEGVALSVSELYAVLNDLLSKLMEHEELLKNLGVDLEGVKLLTDTLEQIENLEGVGDLTVYLTMGSDIVVRDSGAYITGAVASDYNYETDLALGYLAITPDGTKVDLAFNVEDANGLITLKNVQNGNYDLGSHVVEAEGVDVEAASKRLNDLYVGVDYQGNPVIIQGVDNVASQMGVGAYTQVSYIRDLGNEMFYAMPIVRSFAVVTDLVDVRFVGDVDENNQSVFGYDGAEKFMLAEAYDRAGNELDSANITYTYAGIEGDAEGHLSSGKADSVEGPTEVGIYTVIATYVDYAANGEPANVGMTIGSMIITPAEASVTVNDAAHVYNGSPVDVLGMIEKTPADAKMAVVTAGFDVEGEFSLDNLEAVKGVVNVDFPTRVDDVLKQVVPSAYSEGITLTTLINKLSEIEASLEASGTNANGISDLIAMLEQLPNASKLTFKEQADVNPVDNGAYLVGAVIMDPNYQADADLGILIIAPEFATVTFVDDSGSPNNDRLFTYDGNQHAMPVVVKTAAGQTIVGEDLENLKVVYMGVEGDAEGYCSITPPSQVGAYSVVATYVERDANGELLRIGKATGVMAIQPAVAEFEVKDATHIYDGTEKFVEVSNPDGLPQIAYVVVDAQNNVNVIAPESWSVTARELENVDEVIAQLISEFEEMAEATENESRKAALNKLVEILKSVEIETLSINGKKPVAIGEYAVHAIGFGDTNINPAYDKGILSIVERPYSTIQLADGVNDDEVDVTVSYGETTNAVGAEPTEIPAGATTTVKASATDSNKEIVSVTVKDSAGNVVATTDQVAVAAAEAEEIQLEFATPSDKIENYTVNVVLREKDVPGGNEPGGSGGSGDSGESDDPNPDNPNGPTNPDEPSAPGASDGGEGAKPSTGDAKNESQAASVIPNTGDGAGMIMGVFGALAAVAALAVLVAVRRLSVRS